MVQHRQSIFERRYSFSDDNIRLSFLRKVFSILLLETFFCFAGVTSVILIEKFTKSTESENEDKDISNWFQTAGPYILTGFLLMEIALIAIALLQPRWKSDTANFVFLFVFMVVTGLCAGLVSAVIPPLELFIFYTSGATFFAIIGILIFLTLPQKFLQFWVCFLIVGASLILSTVFLFLITLNMTTVIPSIITGVILAIASSVFWNFAVDKMMQDSATRSELEKTWTLARFPNEFILAGIYLFIGALILPVILSVLGAKWGKSFYKEYKDKKALDVTSNASRETRMA